MKTPRTLYLDSTQYEELKRVCTSLGVSISSKIDELTNRFLQEATGKTDAPVSPATYEALKNRHSKLAAKAARFAKQFKSRGVFSELYDFSEKVGLDLSTLNGLAETMPTLLEKWTGGLGDIHEWITFLELVKERREVEAELLKMRTLQCEEVKTRELQDEAQTRLPS